MFVSRSVPSRVFHLHIQSCDSFTTHSLTVDAKYVTGYSFGTVASWHTVCLYTQHMSMAAVCAATSQVAHKLHLSPKIYFGHVLVSF